MYSQYFSHPEKSDGRIPSDSAVLRAGNDRMQSDIINLMMSRNEAITREQAISLLETYTSAFEKILNRQHSAMVSSDKLPVIPKSKVSYLPADTCAETHHKLTDFPILTNCLNVVSNSCTVMWGSVVQLYGQGLLFDRQDTKQGLFLTDSITHLVTKVTSLVRIKPENVIFMIPGGLEPGNYTIELRTRCQQSGSLRAGVWSDLIQVVV